MLTDLVAFEDYSLVHFLIAQLRMVVVIFFIVMSPVLGKVFCVSVWPTPLTGEGRISKSYQPFFWMCTRGPNMITTTDS